MKTYVSDKVPANLLTKNKLKKMGLRPISEHVAFLVYPPSNRKYKLYSLAHARPIDSSTGFSLLHADPSVEARERYYEMTKKFREKQSEEEPE